MLAFLPLDPQKFNSNHYAVAKELLKKSISFNHSYRTGLKTVKGKVI